MTSFAQRMKAVVETLGEMPTIALIDHELGAPLQQAELDAVEQQLGFSLDPKFVDYFREMNGLRLSWVNVRPRKGEPKPKRNDALALWRKYRLKGGMYGSIKIPALKDIFTNARPNQIGEGTRGHQLPILGGWDDFELRSRLRLFDDWDYLLEPGDGRFDLITILASPKDADPIVLRASDHGAALADHHPMRARSYLELMAVTAGDFRRLEFLKSVGGPGDHRLVELSEEDFGGVLSCFGDPNVNRSGYASGHVNYALGLAGLIPPQPKPVPPPPSEAPAPKPAKKPAAKKTAAKKPAAKKPAAKKPAAKKKR